MHWFVVSFYSACVFISQTTQLYEAIKCPFKIVVTSVSQTLFEYHLSDKLNPKCFTSETLDVKKIDLESDASKNPVKVNEIRK